MADDYFHHPFRFPGNVDGPFYTTGCQTHATDDPNSPLVWCGDCLFCEAPELEAPELLAPLNDDNLDTYFLRQPATPNELEHACNAIKVCCVNALRYGGKDRSIIANLGNDPQYCDYVVDENGKLCLVADAETIRRNAAAILAEAQKARQATQQPRRWWQFWR